MNKKVASRILRIIFGILFLACLFLPQNPIAAASPSASLSSEYSKVISGSTFVVKVNLNIPTMTRMNCVNIQVFATNGFSVLTGKQYISSVTSSKSVSFNVKASSSYVTSNITASITYSSLSSCGGTKMSLYPLGTSVTSASAWKLNFQINKPICTLYPYRVSGDPGMYTVTSTTKSFKTTSGAVNSPFSATVSLNPVSDTYTVSFYYTCATLIGTKQWSIIKTITVTKTGQTLYFP